MQNKEIKETGLALNQKPRLSIVAGVFLILGIIVFGFLFFSKSANTNLINAKIGNKSYKLEVANTNETRIKGLSDRISLPENTGVLFDFGKSGDWRIWMKDMHFPIDIAWLNEDKKIIYIKHNATPEEYPETYSATQSSRYVVEVNSGVFKAQEVTVGDKIDF